MDKAQNKEKRSLSVKTIGFTLGGFGIAFGTKDDDTDSLYRKADRAMYHVKTHAKSGYCFYDEIKVCK